MAQRYTQNQKLMIDLIIRESLAGGVDPAYMLAIADKESSFNPNAKNFNGERSYGLFQINTRANPDYKGGFDPVQNTRWAVKHFKGLLNRHNGNLQKAFAAYNGSGKRARAYANDILATRLPKFAKDSTKKYVLADIERNKLEQEEQLKNSVVNYREPSEFAFMSNPHNGTDQQYAPMLVTPNSVKEMRKLNEVWGYRVGYTPQEEKQIGNRMRVDNAVARALGMSQAEFNALPFADELRQRAGEIMFPDEYKKPEPVTDGLPDVVQPEFMQSSNGYAPYLDPKRYVLPDEVLDAVLGERQVFDNPLQQQAYDLKRSEEERMINQSEQDFMLRSRLDGRPYDSQVGMNSLAIPYSWSKYIDSQLYKSNQT